MSDSPYNLRFRSSGDTSDLDETNTAPSSPKRAMSRKFKRRPKAAEKAWQEQSFVAVGRLMRTKRLLLAALRVWELKHGIRD